LPCHESTEAITGKKKQSLHSRKQAAVTTAKSVKERSILCAENKGDRPYLDDFGSSLLAVSMPLMESKWLKIST
jgi:hypothetical protein